MLWNRLDERFGSPKLVKTSLRVKLGNFRKIEQRGNRRLYDSVDILTEIDSIKQQYRSLMSYFDPLTGINPIVSKLLPYAQSRLTD